MYLLSFLPSWHANVGQRLIKASKVYFSDTGILAHLLKINQERLSRQPTFSGPVLENFVFAELVKQRSWMTQQPDLFYFRTASGAEVDFVLEEPAGKVVGIEVKASQQFGLHDLRGMKLLAEAAGKRFHRGIILYLGDKAMPIDKKLYLMPVSALWQL
ncbi:MAG: DUF4143 domain-containing protein [Candidatus Melainabacteria bacterium]|nr:DUF4143 domain-containing protein [Candidatus Melainabacteria bacterium]